MEEPSLTVSKATDNRQLITRNIAVSSGVATAVGTGRAEHSLERVWRAHHCDLPLKQVVIVH